METPYSRIGRYSETKDQEFLSERYGDPRTVDEYKAMVSRFHQDIETPRDSAVAYSGGTVQKVLGGPEGDSLNKHISQWAAEAFSEQYIRIESTPIGRFVFSRIYDPSSPGFLTKEEAKCIELELSAQFAAHASGAVIAMVDQASAQGVFRVEELFRLIENEAVTSINGVSTDELVELAHKSNEQGRDWQEEVFQRIEPDRDMTLIFTPGPEIEENQLKHERGISFGR